MGEEWGEVWKRCHRHFKRFYLRAFSPPLALPRRISSNFGMIPLRRLSGPSPFSVVILVLVDQMYLKEQQITSPNLLWVRMLLLKNNTYY